MEYPSNPHYLFYWHHDSCTSDVFNTFEILVIDTLPVDWTTLRISIGFYHGEILYNSESTIEEGGHNLHGAPWYGNRTFYETAREEWAFDYIMKIFIEMKLKIWFHC